MQTPSTTSPDPEKAKPTAWPAPPTFWWNCCPPPLPWKPGTCCTSSSSGAICPSWPIRNGTGTSCPIPMRSASGGEGDPAPEQLGQLHRGFRRIRPPQRPLALRPGMIHFLGSDATGPTGGILTPGRPGEAILALAGGADFLASCDGHSRLLTLGKVFYPDPPHEPLRKKRGFWAKIFG